MDLSSLELEQFEREHDDYQRILETIRRAPRQFHPDELELVCIGNTGGAANVVHGRPSGGFLLRHRRRTLIVDPGDNTIAFLVSLGFNPYEITDVLASHAHNDHVGDLSLAVSAAINLGLSVNCDSRIVVSPSLIDYTNPAATRLGFTLPAYSWEAHVRSLYHRELQTERFDGEVITSVPDMFLGDDIRVLASEARHGQVLVTGFVIETALGRLGYTSDTEYFEGLSDWFRGVDVLWMNMNTLSLNSLSAVNGLPDGPLHPTHNHLGYVGACLLIDELRPKTAVISHFGAQIVGQRDRIEAMLRTRFAGSGVAIHCAENADSYAFRKTLSEPPLRREFRP